MSQSTGKVSERARSLAETAMEALPASRTRTLRLRVGLVALAGVAPLTATRVAVNSPLALAGLSSGRWFDVATTAALVGPATGAVALGFTADEAWERTGLILAGVFGLLAAVTPAVAGPAVGAVVVGGWLTLVGRSTGTDQTETVDVLCGLVAATLLAALTLSLFGARGVRTIAFRQTGTVLALVGMAATPFAVRAGWRALLAGGLAVAATLYLTLSAPFVSGAVALVAGSVVGASALLLTLAVGGLAATVVEGVANGRVGPAFAGSLLLVAGVPSTLPRAIPVVVAVALLLSAATSEHEAVPNDRGEST